MIKISSIVYLIAVPEMLYVAKELMAKYYNPFQTYFTVGAVYLIIIGILTILLNRLEQALVIPGMDVAKRGG
jgi:polar amino acid transport system permease protein